MAIEPNAKGKVKGTKKNDKITWINSKKWKRALTVNAGSGNDVINFKKSKYTNKLNGQGGNDKIYGGKKADTIKGGAGNDTIYGGSGNDIIYGNSGNDKLYCQGGNNTMYFQSGDQKDYIYSGKGKDTIVFNKVNFSKLYFTKSGQNLVITGYGTDNDSVTIINYYKSSSVKTVKTKDKTLSIESAITKSAEFHKGEINGKHITGTQGNDTLKGTNRDDIIHGLFGSDKIYGYGGNDVLESFITAYIDGGNGNDYLSAEYGYSTMYGGSGKDTIIAGGGYNEIYGGDGDDSIECGYASYVDAGKGKDYISITGNNPEKSEVYGGEGDDTISVSSSNNFIYGGNDNANVHSGNDTIKLSASAESCHIFAEDGDNSIEVKSHDNTISAGNGKNTIDINSYNNTVNLGNGDNVVNLKSYTSYNVNNNTVSTTSGNSTITLLGSYVSDNRLNLGAGKITLNLSNDSANNKGNVITQNGASVSQDIINNAQNYNNVVFLGDGADAVSIKCTNNYVNCGNGDNTVLIDSNYYTDNTIVFGGNGNDTYNVAFGYSSHNNKINDSSGTDSVIFTNNYGYKSNLSFYINVKADTTYDNDLIIYNTSRNDRLTIQNYMAEGKIETIKTYDDYRINNDSINAIIQDVASWLSTNEYADVQAVINSGNTTDISTVLGKFTTAWVKP